MKGFYHDLCSINVHTNGASYQTGWTGTIALLAQMFPTYSKTEIDIKDASRLKIQYEPGNVDESAVESGSSSSQPRT
jgi:hypothetical protein